MPAPSTTDMLFYEQVYSSLTRQCWACTIVGYGFDIMVHYATTGFQLLSAFLRPFLAALFGVWMLFQISTFLAPFAANSPVVVTWQRLLRQSAVMVVVFSLLGNAGLIWDYVGRPALTASLGVAHLMQKELEPVLNAGNAVAAAGALGQLVTGVTINNAWGVAQAFSAILTGECALTAGDYVSTVTQMLPIDRERNLLICQVKTIQKSLAAPIALGYSQMMQDFPKGTFASLIQYSPFYAGLLIFGIFSLIVIAYPLFLLEALFKITLTGVIMPLSLASLLFPSMRIYGIGAFRLFAQSLVNLMILNAVIVIGIALFRRVTQNWSAEDPVSFFLSMAESLSQGGLSGGLANGLSLTSSFFWGMLTIGLMMLAMLSRSGAIAATLTGGMDTGAAAQAVSSMQGSLSSYLAPGGALHRALKPSASRKPKSTTQKSTKAVAN